MIINYVAPRYVIMSIMLLLMSCYRVLSDQKSANVESLCVIDCSILYNGEIK
jgi:hypothetical protein